MLTFLDRPICVRARFRVIYPGSRPLAATIRAWLSWIPLPAQSLTHAGSDDRDSGPQGSLKIGEGVTDRVLLLSSVRLEVVALQGHDHVDQTSYLLNRCKKEHPAKRLRKMHQVHTLERLFLNWPGRSTGHSASHQVA